MGKHGVLIRHEELRVQEAISYLVRAAAELANPLGATPERKAAALLYGSVALMRIAQCDRDERALELATGILARLGEGSDAG